MGQLRKASLPEAKRKRLMKLAGQKTHTPSELKTYKKLMREAYTRVKRFLN